MYNQQDIEQFWLMRIWPLRIAACLTDAKNLMNDKNDQFNLNLEKEKDKFALDIKAYQKAFEKIKTFTSLNQA